MKRSLAMASAAAVACIAAGTPLHAQGSSVDQQSACMTARVGTGVAAPCDDGSAVYFSPAGLAMQRSAFSIGASLISSGNEFTYNEAVGAPTRSVERETENRLVPQVFVNYKASPRLAVGIGAFAPYGSGLKWPVCPVETANTGCTTTSFEGRYTGYDNYLRGLYIQPTVAYQVVPGRLSLGAGVDYVMGEIKVQQRQAGPAQLGNLDIADVTLEGSGSAVTYHLSGLAQLTPRTSVGLRYLHSAAVDVEGDANFVQVLTGVTPIDAQILAGLPANQSVGTTIEFPAQLVAGISFRATEQLNLMADFQRTYWSSFDAFDLNFATAGDQVLALGYQDTNTFRLAGEYAASNRLALRAGFRYNEEATPRATPFLPEYERNYYTAGIGYRVTDALGLDLAYQFVNQPDRAGALRPNGPLAGVYSAHAQVFGLTFAYRFGQQGR